MPKNHSKSFAEVSKNSEYTTDMHTALRRKHSGRPTRTRLPWEDDSHLKNTRSTVAGARLRKFQTPQERKYFATTRSPEEASVVWAFLRALEEQHEDKTVAGAISTQIRKSGGSAVHQVRGQIRRRIGLRRDCGKKAI